MLYARSINLLTEKGFSVTEKPDAPVPGDEKVSGDENWVIPVPATGTPLYALIPWGLYQRLTERSEALERDAVRVDYPSQNWVNAPALAKNDASTFEVDEPWATEPELNRFKGAISQEQIPLEALDRLLEGDHPVKVFRKHRGLTQKELAAMTGLNPTYLSQIETRKRGGSTRVYRRLAAALAVDIGDLID